MGAELGDRYKREKIASTLKRRPLADPKYDCNRTNKLACRLSNLTWQSLDAVIPADVCSHACSAVVLERVSDVVQDQGTCWWSVNLCLPLLACRMTATYALSCHLTNPCFLVRLDPQSKQGCMD